MEHKNKTALVTGASRGIGRAIALHLAGEGLRVVVNYRTSKEEAEAVVSDIHEGEGQAIALQADVADFYSVEKLVKAAREAFGCIDVLVNNAGIHRGAKIHLLSPKDWDIVIRSSLYGAYNCCHHVLPGMIQARWGRIVNISSPVGVRGFPGDGAYAAAKAGMIGLTKSMSRELARIGVTVNAVMPGLVLTDMTMALSEKALQSVRDATPMGQPCEVEEIAAMVSFLVTKGVHITGSVYHVDGGFGT